jgi:O-antigen ligase
MSISQISIASIKLFTAPDILNRSSFEGSIGMFRVTGTMGPNSFGYYLAFLLPLLMIAYEYNKKKIIILIMSIYCFFIFYSGSRSAFVFAAVVLIGYYMIKVYYSRTSLKSVYIVSSLIIIFIVIYFGYLLIQIRRADNLEKFADYSMIARFFVWEGAYKLFITNPVFGAGFGSFVLFSDQVINPLILKLLFMRHVPHAHNFELNILAEMGMVGLIGTILFIYYLLRELWLKGKKTISTDRNYKSLILFVMIIGFLISQQFDFVMASTSHGRDIIYTFLVLGIIHRCISDRNKQILQHSELKNLRL